jgi:hypothetical protein
MIAIGIGMSLMPLAAAQADTVEGEDIVVPPTPAPAPAVVQEKPVSAPPPAWVEIERRSVAAGIGFSWGDGTITFEGHPHAFSVKGLSVGDLGASRLSGLGDVQNLERIEDFAGTYMAVEASIAAGPGASALTMRNEHGVVITLRSDVQGAQLTLGPEGLRIALD